MSNSTFLFPPVHHHHLLIDPNNNSVLDFEDQLLFDDDNSIYDLGFDDSNYNSSFVTASAVPIPLATTSSDHHHHHHHHMASGSSGSSASASSGDCMSTMNKYHMKMLVYITNLFIYLYFM